MASFLTHFISIFAQVLSLAIFVRALLSWFPVKADNPFVVVLVQITDPVLVPLRRLIPTVGMFDLTPMIAIILLNVIADLAANLVRGL